MEEEEEEEAGSAGADDNNGVGTFSLKLKLEAAAGESSIGVWLLEVPLRRRPCAAAAEVLREAPEPSR